MTPSPERPSEPKNVDPNNLDPNGTTLHDTALNDVDPNIGENKPRQFSKEAPDTGETFLRQLRTRAERLARPEPVLGAVIMLAWALLATVGSGQTPVVLMVVVFSLCLHAAAFDTGSHAVLWLTTGWLLLLVAATARTTFEDAGPMVFTIAAITILIHNELVRVGNARRRQAKVEPEALIGSAVGLAIAAVVSIVAVAIADSLAADEGRSWLWVPVAALTLFAVGVMFTILPAWKAPKASRKRWQPGDRIPPQRLDRDL